MLVRGLPTDDRVVKLYIFLLNSLNCVKRNSFLPKRLISRRKKRGDAAVGLGSDQNCNETARGVPASLALISQFTYFHEIFRHARVKFREATGVAANFLAPPKTEAREAEKREGGWESASERGLR